MDADSEGTLPPGSLCAAVSKLREIAVPEATWPPQDPPFHPQETLELNDPEGPQSRASKPGQAKRFGQIGDWQKQRLLSKAHFGCREWFTTSSKAYGFLALVASRFGLRA